MMRKPKKPSSSMATTAMAARRGRPMRLISWVKLSTPALDSREAMPTQRTWRPLGKNYLADGKDCLNSSLQFANSGRKCRAE
ncbi:hypothetical protein D3C72_1724960 [compost metagenome]